MKITREALEMAIAAAGESKMPLILTGHRSVITDVTIDRSYCKFDTWAVRFPSDLPFGIRRYGKVLTKHDREFGPGYNMIVDEGGYRFLDPDGNEVKIEVLEVSPFNDDDVPVLDECELTG
jgi:hypothetical protein